MRINIFPAAGVIAALLMTAVSGSSQTQGRARIMIPSSSIENAGDAGVRAHTNLQILMRAARPATASVTPQAVGLPPFSGYLYETPASIACVYGLVYTLVPGCNPNVTTTIPTGGNGAIAIVDAYDDPNAAADLAYFSAQFGLPNASFQVVYANGTKPAVDSTGGWELEESLDIEWAHAMAPNAQIYLVEAATNSFSNLLNAVTVASQLVAAAGGGEVSMSWGGTEFSGEVVDDVVFSTPRVVYVASSGDSPGVIWPGTSPAVVSAGGTTLSRNTSTGKLFLENVWQEAGSGSSAYEARPSFQDSIASIVGSKRGIPDMSFDSNPATGVWVYDSNNFPSMPPGWYTVGGTSVAAPSLAGVFNLGNAFRASSAAQNAFMYQSASNGVGVNDITYGNCGIYASLFAGPGWDFCSGLGSPSTLNGK